QTAWPSRIVAHGERRDRGIDTGGRCPRVRRTPLRPVLHRIGYRDARKGPKSAAAQQRALQGRRVRHAPHPRSYERLVVRYHRRADSPQQRNRIAPPVARIDWVGRPEHTNVRLNNPGLSGIDDLRDLWNQQTPFAIPKDLQPMFLKRLKDSFVEWDM